MNILQAMKTGLPIRRKSYSEASRSIYVSSEGLHTGGCIIPKWLIEELWERDWEVDNRCKVNEHDYMRHIHHKLRGLVAIESNPEVKKELQRLSDITICRIKCLDIDWQARTWNPWDAGCLKRGEE